MDRAHGSWRCRDRLRRGRTHDSPRHAGRAGTGGDEAALFAGKLHLGAHALGLGAVGSTSVDDEVIRFFSPHAAGKSYMFIVVFGRRRKRATATEG